MAILPERFGEKTGARDLGTAWMERLTGDLILRGGTRGQTSIFVFNILAACLKRGVGGHRSDALRHGTVLHLIVSAA